VRRTARLTALVRREAAAAQRGQREGARAHASPLQGLLQTQDDAALGAAGHQAVQAGHAASRHLVHRAPPQPGRRRRREDPPRRRRPTPPPHHPG